MEMHQRKLNEIEYMNWTMGQPFNISMAISIKGAIDPKDMENALRKVQQKHPMLRAQLYTDHKKKPHFIWGKVGSIPLKILKRNSEDHYKNVVEKEFITPFETGKECKLPLARAIFLRDETHSDLALTLQHVIADGLSMVYLFLDLFRFLRRPKRAPKENKIMKNAENILPRKIRKKMPQSSFKFRILHGTIRILVGFKRLFRKILNPKSGKRKLGKQAVSGSSFQTKSWKLSKEKTRKLLKKCKENEVKVHSAVCTAFALDFSEINNPVNLRNRLDRDIRGEVGLFASGLILKTKYTQETNFWDNARTYQRRLTKALKSDKVFQVFKVFSRAVPKSRLQKFSPLFVELLSNKQAFAITNIGNLDRMGTFRGRNKREKYEIENFFGGVSETFDVIMVTVFTVNAQLHFHLHYYDPPHNEEEIDGYIENAKNQLERAFN